MTRNTCLLALCVAALAQAGAVAAAADPAQMQACLRPPSAAAGLAACDRLLAGDGLTTGETVQATSARAFSRAATGAADQAVADMDALVARFPDHARAEGTRALLLLGLERMPQAEVSARRAIGLDDSLPVPYYVLAESLASRGDDAGALLNFERATVLGPDIPEAQNGRCWTLAAANQSLDKALAACDRAIALKKDAYFLDSRGFVHFRMGNHAAAIGDFDAALALEQIAESYFVRGLAKQALGQASAGQADLAEANRLDPTVAATFAAWGVMPAAADPRPAPRAATPAAASPRREASAAAATPTPREASALARAEADYARQRDRLLAAQSRLDQAEQANPDAGHERFEGMARQVDDLRNRESQAIAALLAAGGHPELVPAPGSPLVVPQPGSPAAARIAEARARYMAAREKYSAAARQSEYGHSVGWMTQAQRDGYDAKLDESVDEVAAAKAAFFAALAAAR